MVTSAERLRRLLALVPYVVSRKAVGLAETAAAFGMTVIGIDPRVRELPSPVVELHPPEDLPRVLPRADFVIMTTPETFSSPSS